MSRFCGGDGVFNFSLQYDELLNSLVNKGKYFLHWKWLHDQLLFWKQEITKSELFQEQEVQDVLQVLCPYLCQIFNDWNGRNYKNLLCCLRKDAKWRYKSYPEIHWACLLVPEDSKDNFYEGEEESNENDESNVEICSDSTHLSLGNTVAEEFQTFLIKMDYLLDILFPNNFQYVIYKKAFGPDSELKDYEIIFPYLFAFASTYLSQDENLEDFSETNQGKESGKNQMRLKKEKKINLPVTPLAYQPKIKKEPTPLQKETSILPLNMALEINEEFWKAIEEIVEEEIDPSLTNTKSEKEVTQSMPEIHEKSKKSLKKK